MKYLEGQCGLSPNRANEFVRPILLNENNIIINNDTYTPLKYLALKEFGPSAFSKKITPLVNRRQPLKNLNIQREELK